MRQKKKKLEEGIRIIIKSEGKVYDTIIVSRGIDAETLTEGIFDCLKEKQCDPKYI